MRFRFGPLCAALVCLSCASGPVRLERYRAAYSTHFEGIPDQAEACAVVRNRGAHPIEWLELRMRARSHFGGDQALKSKWLYRGHVEPGETVALRFVYPPVADELELSFVRAGTTGPGPQDRRPLLRAEECSDESLRAVLDAELRGRTAPDIELRSAERVTPDAPDESLVAAP
jgi:hypothetical protein